MSSSVLDASRQVWPPFVLVAGLLMIGAVLEREGVFAAAGARIERVGGSPVRLLAALLGLEAIVTALLNLDTAVVFLTPVLLHAAGRRRCDVRPFLYGALLIANGASILLPGSNLTNLIVLAHERLSGAAVAEAMVVPWLATIVLTVAFLAAWYRPHAQAAPATAPPPLHIGTGVLASVAATALILSLANPALPVLGVGLLAVARARLRPRLDLHVLAGLFLVAVALGTLARRWHGPAQLLAGLGGVGTAAVGAAAGVVVNNLPAAALLAARRPPHPLPLVVGLDLGPNLAVTGSLAAYLWYTAARAVGVRPSLVRVSVLGLVLAPLTIAAALATLYAVDPGSF
jgi:arsenical pump membrane protein